MTNNKNTRKILIEKEIKLIESETQDDKNWVSNKNFESIKNRRKNNANKLSNE